MYYGQQRLDEVLHRRFFNPKENGFFVECGAYDGLTESTCKFFEESLNWTGLNIEPVPFIFERLLNNRPNCINECVALSDNNNTHMFSHAIHPRLQRNFGNGSLKHTQFHLDELNKEGCTFEQFEVQCRTFDVLFKKHNLPPIDLFVLDVEGHELQALDGILQIPENFLPKVFCIEYTLSGLKEITGRLSKFYNFDDQYEHNAFFLRK